MKVIACLPCYKIMDVPAVSSLLALQAGIFSNGDEIKILIAHNYLVDKARQLLVEKALEEEADIILNIDSDHTFSPEQFYKLYWRMKDNNLQMLSAKYYVRNALVPPRPLAMCNWNDETRKYEKIIPPADEKGIQDCDAVGNGFVIIRHDFMKHLHAKYKTLYSLSQYGEDIYFCELVRKSGERVCYDADTIVGHLSLVNNK